MRTDCELFGKILNMSEPEAYGENCMYHAHMLKWYKRFSKDFRIWKMNSLEDLSLRIEENIENNSQIVQEDCQLKGAEVSIYKYICLLYTSNICGGRSQHQVGLKKSKRI